jgi:hypothetical protein
MGRARLEARYEIRSKIASGGTATAYRGRVVGPGGSSRQVAITRMHAQFAKDPEFVAMFMDEARTTHTYPCVPSPKPLLGFHSRPNTNRI